VTEATPTDSSPTSVLGSPAAPATPAATVGRAEQAKAKRLLVAGPDLGRGWTAAEVPPVEDKHEQGDLCSTVTAGERNRLFEVSADLTNDTVEGAARHELARYRPGTAPAAARTILDLLVNCPKGKQDFDGQPAEVAVTPAWPNTVTFALTFGPGAINYVAITVAAAGDYLSTSASFANDAKTAASLAGKLAAAARKKLAAAGIR